MVDWLQLGLAGICAAAAAGGAYAAVRVELRWMRRDIDEVRDAIGLKRLVRRTAH